MSQLAAHLLCFLLEFVDGSFVDTTAFVDEVTSRCRLAGVDVTDDHNIDVDFLLRHDW